jgi:hypothetical protein
VGVVHGFNFRRKGRVIFGEDIWEITFTADADNMLDGVSTSYTMPGEMAGFEKVNGMRDISCRRGRFIRPLLFIVWTIL